MRKDAKEEATELVKEYYGNCTDFIDSNKEAKEAAICFAIITQQRIIDLPIWFVYNEEELDHQIEILKEIEKL